MGTWGALSIQPKILEILVRNQINVMDHFGSVWPEYLGPALKGDHFDLLNHSSWSGGNVLFHLGKLLCPVQFFCILLTRTITKCVVACVWSVQPECTVPLGTWNFQIFFFHTKIFVEWKVPQALDKNLCWSWRGEFFARRGLKTFH